MLDPLWCIQVFGVFLGILGAVINTSPDLPARVLSFRIWTVANVLLLGWSVICSVFLFALLYGTYCAIAIFGIVRNGPSREVHA